MLTLLLQIFIGNHCSLGAVTNVTSAVMVLMAPNGKIPKDRSWKAAKVCRENINLNYM